MTSRIIGTGRYIPKRKVINDDLSNIMETSDEWIRSRTGIAARHITAHGTSHMASEAAKAACENAGVSPESLEIIILATSSADQSFPNGACEVQKAIGAVNAVGYDISAACAGFIFALHTLHAFIKAGIYKRGLIIGADTMSGLLNWDDRSTCVLFGDGAGAAVVEAAETGLISMDMGADGTKGDVLTRRNHLTGNPFIKKDIPEEQDYVKMDGQEVFKFAVKKVPESVNNVLIDGSCTKEKVKYYILHQANERIIQSVSKRLALPPERFPINLMNYGNTSAASIPIILDEMNRDNKLEKGDLIVLSGFGAGLTWGSTLLAW